MSVYNSGSLYKAVFLGQSVDVDAAVQYNPLSIFPMQNAPVNPAIVHDILKSRFTDEIRVGASSTGQGAINRFGDVKDIETLQAGAYKPRGFDANELHSTAARPLKLYELGNYIDKTTHFESWNEVKDYLAGIIIRLIGSEILKWDVDKQEQLIPDFKNTVTVKHLLMAEASITTVEALERAFLDYNDVISVFFKQKIIANFEYDGDLQNKQKEDVKDNIENMFADLQTYRNTIQKLFINHPLFNHLPNEVYGLMKSRWRILDKFFSPKNVEVLKQFKKLVASYNKIMGGIAVVIDGKTMTRQKAAVLLESTDKAVREKAWIAIKTSTLPHRDELNRIYNDMLELWQDYTDNLGLQDEGIHNYRDVIYTAGIVGDEPFYLGYTVEDSKNIHDSIRNHIVPIIKKIQTRHRERLEISEEDYKPWDASATPVGIEPLRPFETIGELLLKTIFALSEIHPEFAINVSESAAGRLFDLENRPNKRGGGYMMDLPVIQKPPIFANSTLPGTQSNVKTLVHEAGHLNDFRVKSHLPFLLREIFTVEAVETHSMAMELVSMAGWHHFYPDRKDQLRAEIDQLESSISSLSWMAVVDALQHWVYENPGHTNDERSQAFNELMKSFGSYEDNTWKGLEKYQTDAWHSQGHIFWNPFYYLQYAIARLGSLQIWRNYLANPEEALEKWILGMKQGGTKTTEETYQIMGIEFDFSSEKIQELAGFVEAELEKRYKELKDLGG